MGRSIDLEWKRCELDTMLGRTMSLLLGQSACQMHWPSNGLMWNYYSFQPVGPWMGCPFTDLGAEGCCRPLNALFVDAFVYADLTWHTAVTSHSSTLPELWRVELQGALNFDWLNVRAHQITTKAM